MALARVFFITSIVALVTAIVIITMSQHDFGTSPVHYCYVRPVDATGMKGRFAWQNSKRGSARGAGEAAAAKMVVGIGRVDLQSQPMFLTCI